MESLNGPGVNGCRGHVLHPKLGDFFHTRRISMCPCYTLILAFVKHTWFLDVSRMFIDEHLMLLRTTERYWSGPQQSLLWLEIHRRPCAPIDLFGLQGGHRVVGIVSKLQVMTNLGDPAAHHEGILCRRPLSPSTASPGTFEVARAWLRECLKAEECLDSAVIQRGIPSGGASDQKDDALDNHRTLPAATERPKRLIQLLGTTSGTSLKLVAVSDTYGSYVALSHCWGPAPWPWMTTRKSVEARLKGFSDMDLPKTLRDACTATHMLGIRYIWIDSLCIVQDDMVEWASEAAKMGTIYRNAILTIAALAAESSHVDLFYQRPPHHEGWFKGVTDKSNAEKYAKEELEEISLLCSHVTSSVYSPCQLTYARNRLVAVSALAKSPVDFHHYLELSYQSGTFHSPNASSNVLLNGLLWARCNERGTYIENYAPSWSWASQDGKVGFTVGESTANLSRCTWIHADPDLAAFDPPGTVPDRRLTLKAQTLTGHLCVETWEAAEKTLPLIWTFTSPGVALTGPIRSQPFSIALDKPGRYDGEVTLLHVSYTHETVGTHYMLLVKPSTSFAGKWMRIGLAVASLEEYVGPVEEYEEPKGPLVALLQAAEREITIV